MAFEMRMIARMGVRIRLEEGVLDAVDVHDAEGEVEGEDEAVEVEACCFSASSFSARAREINSTNMSVAKPIHTKPRVIVCTLTFCTIDLPLMRANYLCHAFVHPRPPN
jgi:hypothetical protein